LAVALSALGLMSPSDEEASNRLRSPLAQLDVVRAVPDAVGVAFQLDDEVGILLKLLAQLEQRRLGAVVDVGAVEPEEDGDGVAGHPLVAVCPEPRQPCARLVGLGVRLARARVGLVGARLSLTGLRHAFVGATLSRRGEAGRFGGASVDLLDLGSRLTQLVRERDRLRLFLGEVTLDAADIRRELRLALPDLLTHELLGRAAGGDE
jgi:hypothetical protein